MKASKLEELAKFLRQRSQMAGISNTDPWDEISEARKDQWRRMAVEFEGYSIIPTESLEAMIKIVENNNSMLLHLRSSLEKMFPDAKP